MMQDRKTNVLLHRLATGASVCALGFAAMSVGMLFAPIDAQSYHASSRVAVEPRDATSFCTTPPCTNLGDRPAPRKTEPAPEDAWPTTANSESIGYDDDDRPEYRKGIRNTDFGPDPANLGEQDRDRSAFDFRLSLRPTQN